MTRELHEKVKKLTSENARLKVRPVVGRGVLRKLGTTPRRPTAEGANVDAILNQHLREPVSLEPLRALGVRRML